MSPTELANLSAQLKSEVTPHEACFGIFQYGGGSDESFIRANKEGLQLFAAELLAVQARVDATLAHATKTLIPFEYTAEWMDGDTFINYVEPIDVSPKQDLLIKPTLSDKAVILGVAAGGIFVITSFLIGLVTIARWLFK